MKLIQEARVQTAFVINRQQVQLHYGFEIGKYSMGKELTAYKALLDEIVREIEQHRIKAARGLNATEMQLLQFVVVK